MLLFIKFCDTVILYGNLKYMYIEETKVLNTTSQHYITLQGEAIRWYRIWNINFSEFFEAGNLDKWSGISQNFQPCLAETSQVLLHTSLNP